MKLFYARDFRALMLKYGRLALADALSGTSGQVAAPHVTAAEVDAAIAAEARVAEPDRTASLPETPVRTRRTPSQPSMEGSAIHR